jgi:hypothetical protein
MYPTAPGSAACRHAAGRNRHLTRSDGYRALVRRVPTPRMIGGLRPLSSTQTGSRKGQDARSGLETPIASCPLSCTFGERSTCMLGHRRGCCTPVVPCGSMCGEGDPLVGAMMWAHDAQVHMLVLPAQTATSEDHVLTSCGTRDGPPPCDPASSQDAAIHYRHSYGVVKYRVNP